MLEAFCSPSYIEKELEKVIKVFEKYETACVAKSRFGPSICLLVWPRLKARGGEGGEPLRWEPDIRNLFSSVKAAIESS